MIGILAIGGLLIILCQAFIWGLAFVLVTLAGTIKLIYHIVKRCIK